MVKGCKGHLAVLLLARLGYPFRGWGYVLSLVLSERKAIFYH